MQKIYGVLLLLLLLCSCTNTVDDPCEGLILDLITQTLIIELVDEDGNNLIENETYDKDFLFHERNGFITKPVVYNEADFASLPDEFKNVIVLTVYSNGDRENLWTIHLNEQEIDTLELNLEVESDGCSGPFYNILDIKYNEDSISFEDIDNNTYKIAVLK